jgi:hypothetical protein
VVFKPRKTNFLKIKINLKKINPNLIINKKSINFKKNQLIEKQNNNQKNLKELKKEKLSN